MIIRSINDLEDCFDGTFIKEVLFCDSVNKEFIHYLGNEGELDYFPDFAKPFFRIYLKGMYFIKGVEGNNTLRLILNKEEINKGLDYFVLKVKNYKTQ